MSLAIYCVNIISILFRFIRSLYLWPLDDILEWNFPIFSHFVCNNAFILIKSVHFEIIVFDTIFTNILSIPIIWSIFPVQVVIWNFQKSSFEHNLFHQLWFTNITNEHIFLVVNQINSSFLCYICDSIYTSSQISHCNLRK